MRVTRDQLKAAFNYTGSDKTTLHGYEGMYFRVINDIPALSRILEVGIFKGGSVGAWCNLFPDVEVTGVDIKLREDIHADAFKAQLLVGDSTDASIKTIVGDGYDLIIDDGDHRPEAQLATFNNLEGCWNHAYVIEDVVGSDHEKKLRANLVSRGYVVNTYSSKKQNVPMMMSGKERMINFYAMVITKL